MSFAFMKRQTPPLEPPVFKTHGPVNPFTSKKRQRDLPPPLEPTKQRAFFNTDNPTPRLPPSKPSVPVLKFISKGYATIYTPSSLSAPPTPWSPTIKNPPKSPSLVPLAFIPTRDFWTPKTRSFSDEVIMRELVRRRALLREELPHCVWVELTDTTFHIEYLEYAGIKVPRAAFEMERVWREKESLIRRRKGAKF